MILCHSVKWQVRVIVFISVVLNGYYSYHPVTSAGVKMLSKLFLLLYHPDLIHCQFSTTTILGLSPSNFTIIVDISITFYRKSLLLPSPKYILSIYLSSHTCTHTTGRFMKAFHQTPTIESLFTCSLGIEFRTSQARQTRYH